MFVMNKRDGVIRLLVPEDPMKNLCLAAAVLIAFAVPLRRSVDAAPALDGLWDAVASHRREVPFRFRLRRRQ